MNKPLPSPTHIQMGPSVSEIYLVMQKYNLFCTLYVYDLFHERVILAGVWCVYVYAFISIKKLIGGKSNFSIFLITEIMGPLYLYSAGGTSIVGLDTMSCHFPSIL
jgi:hypothetical protein